MDFWHLLKGQHAGWGNKSWKHSKDFIHGPLLWSILQQDYHQGVLMAIKIFCTKNNIKCIYVKENNDLSHGEKSQGSWCWGMGEEWGWEEGEYLQRERRRGPLYCEQGSRLGITVKGNVFSFFWLDTTWKKWSWRKLWLAMGRIQNLVKSGALSSYWIHSWPARCTDNRLGRGILNASLQMGNIMSGQSGILANRKTFCSCF